MRIKTILEHQIPLTRHHNFEEMYYGQGGWITIIIVGTSLEDKNKKLKVTIKFNGILALRITDERTFLGDEGEFPNVGTLDEELFIKYMLFEFFDTKFLNWYNETSVKFYTDEARHFCI